MLAPLAKSGTLDECVAAYLSGYDRNSLLVRIHESPGELADVLTTPSMARGLTADDDDTARAAAVGLVAGLLGGLPELPLDAGPLTRFFCDRLRDTPCHKEVLAGLVALVQAHNVTDAAVWEALYRELAVQRLTQSARNKVFTILELLMPHHHTALAFVRGFVQAMDGEKDPRNLIKCFAIASYVLRHYGVVDDSDLLEELFDVTACYYPITFTPPKNDPYGITREQLQSGLQQCLGAHEALAPLVFPLLLDENGGPPDWDMLAYVVAAYGTAEAVRKYAAAIGKLRPPPKVIRAVTAVGAWRDMELPVDLLPVAAATSDSAWREIVTDQWPHVTEPALARRFVEASSTQVLEGGSQMVESLWRMYDDSKDADAILALAHVAVVVGKPDERLDEFLFGRDAADWTDLHVRVLLDKPGLPVPAGLGDRLIAAGRFARELVERVPCSWEAVAPLEETQPDLWALLVPTVVDKMPPETVAELVRSDRARGECLSLLVNYAGDDFSCEDPWATRGLVMRGLGQERVAALYARALESAEAALAFGDVLLRPSTRAKHTALFYAQKFFYEWAPKLIAHGGEHATLALCLMVPHAPRAVVAEFAGDIYRIVGRALALGLEDAVFCVAVERADDVDTVVRALLRLSRESARVDVRVRAVEELHRSVDVLPVHEAGRLKNDIVRSLHPVLDDPKRRVRQACRKARNAWLLL